MRAIVVGLLLLLVVFSGCVGEDAETGDDKDKETETEDENPGNNRNVVTTLTLDAFTECDFSFAGGGGSVPCQGDFELIEAESRAAPTLSGDQWICVGRIDDRNVQGSIHWDPVGEVHGIHYTVANQPEWAESVHGYFIQAGDDANDPVQVVWYEAPLTGFITVPGMYEGAYRFMWYNHGYESDSPELQGGSIRAEWTLHEESPYPLQVLESGGTDYYFHNVTISEAGDDTFYRINPVSITGGDFNLTIEYHRLDNERGRTFDHQPAPGCGV